MLRAIVSLQHCVKNVIDSWMANSGYKISRYPGEPTYGRGLVAKDDGSIGCATAASSTRTLVVVDFAPWMVKDTPLTQISFGYRVKLEQVGLNLGDYCAWFDTTTYGANGQAFLYFSHYFDANSKVGDEKLIESTLDLTTNTLSTYFNGVLAGTAAINGNLLAGLKAGQFQICLNLSSANAAGSVSIRNFWVTDNLPGDGMTGRIGDVTAVPIVLDEATGTGWSASDGGSLLAPLKVNADAANPVLVNSAPGAGELSVGLSVPSLPANSSIKSLMLFGAGKTSSPQGRIGISMKKGTAKSGTRVLSAGTTLTYGLPFGTWAKAPDGTPWTQASVDATSLVITPDL